MFGRKRREARADTEQQLAFDRQERWAQAEERSARVRRAKSEYIAGTRSFGDLWPTWWHDEIRRRPGLPVEAALHALVCDVLELERARLTPYPEAPTTSKEH